MKILLGLASLMLLSYISMASYLYAFQRDLLYFPTQAFQHPFERMSVTSHGETIEVIVLNKGKTSALMYFGGNGEAVVANAKEFSTTFKNITVYLINYRGYGGSSGEPSESGHYADALTIYDELSSKHSTISVAGRSLGSGVATYLAANRAVKNVALITPYDSVLNIAKNQYGYFPVQLLLKDQYDSLSRAKSITSKVLVLAAEHDQVIPMSHTQRLVNEFNRGQVILKIIKDTGHNSISNSAEYYNLLSEFIK